MNARARLMLAASLLTLAGCTTMPSGPSVLVLPGTGKNFDQFRIDDAECRQFAQGQTGPTAESAQVDSAVKSAAIGAAIGAAAGALAGNHRNAAAGAAVGLIGGSIVGAGTANASGHDAQRRYDNGYQQCMYAKGHRVPVAGSYGPPQQQPAAPPSPPAAQPQYAPPPPPPNAPPPPPRG